MTRARMSAQLGDYPGCTYYMKPFREKFAENRWKPLGILKYQNWNTSTEESDQIKCRVSTNVPYAMQMCCCNSAECYLRSSSQQNLNKSKEYINQICCRANLNDYSGAMTADAIFKD